MDGWTLIQVDEVQADGREREWFRIELFASSRHYLARYYIKRMFRRQVSIGLREREYDDFDGWGPLRSIPMDEAGVFDATDRDAAIAHARSALTNEIRRRSDSGSVALEPEHEMEWWTLLHVDELHVEIAEQLDSFRIELFASSRRYSARYYLRKMVHHEVTNLRGLPEPEYDDFDEWGPLRSMPTNEEDEFDAPDRDAAIAHARSALTKVIRSMEEDPMRAGPS